MNKTEDLGTPELLTTICLQKNQDVYFRFIKQNNKQIVIDREKKKKQLQVHEKLEMTIIFRQKHHKINVCVFF